MKKIGILTFNRAINYGAVLQAYALKRRLSDYRETEIINYICPHIEKGYETFDVNLLKSILRFLSFRKKNKNFHKFIEGISSEKLYDKQNLSDADYEKIIIGSDQVWNYSCTGDDETFLLPNMKTKKYSYAASFGVSEIPKQQISFFKENLAEFRYLSVREKTGQALCEKQLGLMAETVVDPTLLLSKEDWANSFNIQSINKKYILLYSFGKNQEYIVCVKRIAKLMGLPIFNISTSVKDFFGDKVIKSAGPKEWVSLFYNAAFVVTNSFHGTAFAINFNKPFYAFARNKVASRIVDLLNTLGLQDRLNPTLDKISSQTEIDYISVNEKLEEERKKSIVFIEKIIND